MDTPQAQVPAPPADPPPADAPSQRSSRRTDGITAVLQEMRQPLKLLFRRFRLQPHEVEDIAQSALTILVRDWHLVDNPRGYLLATVRRQISHHFRRLAAEKLDQLDEHLRELASEDPATGLDRRLDALRLLSRLPPSIRQVALLHYVAGMTHQEIAAALDQPEPAVRQLLS